MDYTKMDDNQILALGRAGEDEATEFLLQKYGYLVKREVRTVYLIGAETEDLAQEGMIGLFKAIRDYSPDKAASFSTFASVCIRRQIQNAITNSNRKKHVPLNSYVSLYMNSEEGDNFMLEERLSTSREEDPEKLLIAREQIEDRNARIKKELSNFEKIRRTPRSTLFPYPPLLRSYKDKQRNNKAQEKQQNHNHQACQYGEVFRVLKQITGLFPKGSRFGKRI